jgi:hypothetical protein
MHSSTSCSRIQLEIRFSFSLLIQALENGVVQLRHLFTLAARQEMRRSLEVCL